MPRSFVPHLLAARPSGAAIASLFSEGFESEPLRRRVAHSRNPSAPLLPRALSRVRDMLMMQVLCEDIAFPAHPARRRMHT